MAKAQRKPPRPTRARMMRNKRVSVMVDQVTFKRLEELSSGPDTLSLAAYRVIVAGLQKLDE